MEKVNLDGLIIVLIRGNFKIMLYKVEENMYGLMGDGMRAIGLTIRCMDMVNRDGQMGRFMLVILKMISSMEKGNLSMMKTRHTKVNGLMESSMEMDLL